MFDVLKQNAGEHWLAYIQHEFVKGIGDGSLPLPAFQYYLRQDYLFLKHFARAFALAVFKSDTLELMRQAENALSGILNSEMDLHVTYCADWGISRDDLEATEEDPAVTAYTSYVLERGLAGDLLDLRVALAPCIIGYGHVGSWLMSLPSVADNPYQSWIDMYGGNEYQATAQSEIEHLDDLASALGTKQRMPKLQEIFTNATRLEIAFWDMGLKAV